MPIYEYRCDSCGHDLEVLQKMSDEPLRDCPECTEPALRKLVSAAGFRLKGTGWYATDFKNGSKPPKPSSDGEAKPSSDSASKSPSDSASKPSTDSASKSSSGGAQKAASA